MRIRNLLICLAIASIAVTSFAQSDPPFEIELSPAALTLDAGGAAQAVDIKVTRRGFAGPVMLAWTGSDERISLSGDPESRLGPAETSRRFEFRASADATAGVIDYTLKARGFRIRDVMAATRDGEDAAAMEENALEQEVTLSITILPRPAAALRVEPEQLALQMGQPQKVTVHVSGERGYAGPVIVQAASSPSVEASPARKELATLPASFEVTVVLKTPIPASDPAHEVRWNAQAPRQPGVVLAESATGISYVAPKITPAFELKPREKTVTLSGISTSAPAPVQTTLDVEATGGGGWNGKLQVSAKADELLQIEPAQFVLDTGDPSNRAMTLNIVLPAESTGLKREQVLVHLEATPEEAGPARKLTVPVLFRYASDVPAVDEPLPEITGVVPELIQHAQRVDVENAHLRDISEALDGKGVIDSQMAAAQAGFAEFYLALVEELQNPVSLAEGTDVDPEVLARMIEQSGVLHRYAQYQEATQVASLATPTGGLLFSGPMEYGLESVGMGKPVPWQTYNSIEILIQELRLRRTIGMIQPGTERMREILGEIDDMIEKIGGEDAAEKVKKAKALLKAYAVAGAAITVADNAAKAVMAFMPGEITSFYTVINGKPREENDPPVALKMGQKADVKVMLKTRSLGGQIITPGEIAGWIWDNIPEKDKQKAKLTDAEKTALKIGIQKDTKSMIDKVWERVSNVPKVKEWIDSINKSFDIRPFDNRPVECNSTRVLDIASRSERLLKVTEEGNAKNQRYAITGIHETNEGQTAGYGFGLKEYLVDELQQATARGVKLWDVRAVVTIGQKKDKPKDDPCKTDGFQACRIVDGSGERGPDWSTNYVVDSSGPGVVICDQKPGGKCECSCNLPH